MGTLLTGCANIYFAVIDPSAPYWVSGFPSACLIVLGVGFTFASGTMFITKVSLPSEQSVAGALFQVMTTDRVRDRPQRVHDRLQWGAQGAVEPPSCPRGSGRKWRTPGSAAQGVPGCDVDGLCVWDSQWVLEAPRPGLGYATDILICDCSGTTLCIFLRGVGIVGERPTPDRKVEPKGHASCDEKESDLDATQNKTSNA